MLRRARSLISDQRGRSQGHPTIHKRCPNGSLKFSLLTSPWMAVCCRVAHLRRRKCRGLRTKTARGIQAVQAKCTAAGGAGWTDWLGLVAWSPPDRATPCGHSGAASISAWEQGIPLDHAWFAPGFLNCRPSSSSKNLPIETRGTRLYQVRATAGRLILCHCVAEALEVMMPRQAYMHVSVSVCDTSIPHRHGLRRLRFDWGAKLPGISTPLHLVYRAGGLRQM